MITIIIYINEDGIVDSHYRRILEFDINNNQIHLLGISRTDFQEDEERVYNEISEWTCNSKEWKLILVDDARVLCEEKAENCQKNCTLNGRNAYYDFKFSEQVRILSGHIKNPCYTAVPPQEFYLIRTRADAQYCPRDLAYDGRHVREVQGLPANIRYMVYDFQNRGEFFREECEWKLFFCLWLLARDEIAVDWMDIYKIYRMEIDWDAFKLYDFIEELRQQLTEFQNELESSEIPIMRKPGIPETNINLNKGGHPGKRIIIHGKTEPEKKKPWIKAKWCKDLLSHLEKTRKEIEAQGHEAFREIQSGTRSIGIELKADSYEEVLKIHYEKGNESFDDITDEIKKLKKQLDSRRKTMISVVIPGVEIALIIIVFMTYCPIIIVEDLEGLGNIVLCVLAFNVVYFFCYLYSKQECAQELRPDYWELSKKVDEIISKKLNRINIQFDKMTAYKEWINQKYVQNCAAESEDLKRTQARTHESEIENALAFCDKLDVFAKKNQIKVRNEYRYLEMETERFYYPAGWRERQCACDVQGQSVRCPYYFLNHVIWKTEYGEG